MDPKNGGDEGGEPTSSSKLQLEINPSYIADSFGEEFRQCLDGAHPNSLPFPHFSLENFLLNGPSIAQSLREELLNARWHRKSNDLYSLSQTADLAQLTTGKEGYPVLKAFLEFLKGEVKEWLQRQTGVELNGKVAVTGMQ